VVSATRTASCRDRSVHGTSLGEHTDSLPSVRVSRPHRSGFDKSRRQMARKRYLTGRRAHLVWSIRSRPLPSAAPSPPVAPPERGPPATRRHRPRAARAAPARPPHPPRVSPVRGARWWVRGVAASGSAGRVRDRWGRWRVGGCPAPGQARGAARRGR
jgi:hypothetical protein